MTEKSKAAARLSISRLAWGVGALYAVLGCVWIVASDALVTAVSRDAEWLASAQRYKGLFHVLLTSLALVALVRAGYRRLLDAVERADAKELQVRDLFLHHPTPMWLHDRETLAFLAVNDAAVQYYGHTRQSFMSMRLADLCLEPEAAGPQAFMPPADPGQREIGVVRHRKRSGERVFVHLTAHTVEFQQRKADMVMAVDVTADMASKRALERQEAQFRQLHQSLSSVLWMASADGRELLYISPALEPIYGLMPQAMQDDPTLWLQVVHPQDMPIAQASNAELLKSGQASCHYRIRSASGQVKWVSDRKRLIRDDEGRVVMMGGILEDITPARELEALRAATHVELERQVAQRTAELVRLNGELDAFARTIAHDLKSPLVSVAGFTQLLQRRHAATLGEDGLKLVMRVERSARQMASLVTDLLALSRLSTATLNLQAVDLAPMAREIVQELREQEPGRQVCFECPPALPVRADPGLMRPLLVNLLANAWKFTGKRADAHIALRLQAQAPVPTFCIQDNGAGFDSSAGAERLFQPFQRFHTLSEFSGSGIGLATCQRIAARHCGRVWVESTPGNGASVFVALGASPKAPLSPAG